MEIALIGLGKMGGNMAERLLRGGHRVIGYDRSDAALARLRENAGVSTQSLGALVEAFTGPRAIWMMVPAGAPVDETIAALAPRLAKGDILIDGGNSNYKDTIARAGRLAADGLAYVDVG